MELSKKMELKEIKSSAKNSSAKNSLPKKIEFIGEMTRKIARRFGKDVLVLIEFSKNGCCSVVSPA